MSLVDPGACMMMPPLARPETVPIISPLMVLQNSIITGPSFMNSAASAKFDPELNICAANSGRAINQAVSFYFSGRMAAIKAIGGELYRAEMADVSRYKK